MKSSKGQRSDRREGVYEPGDLVEILTDRTASSDSITTAFTCRDGGIKLYETILAQNYPSCDDFTGSHVECMPGQTASVVRYMGRPNRIRRAYEFWEYDIYEVLTGGHQVQVFANNMRLIMSSSQ